ncbi:unnamed protein product [Cuscuta epithymum]|uniref:Uncharacterized protein n=2 Tax=Cuscuta epithymum TaxID=186058 RepID=A0AAV0CHK0_9ASTE|nr:unnamed protein product [Cuscuta epithymum]
MATNFSFSTPSSSSSPFSTSIKSSFSPFGIPSIHTPPTTSLFGGGSTIAAPMYSFGTTLPLGNENVHASPVFGVSRDPGNTYSSQMSGSTSFSSGRKIKTRRRRRVLPFDNSTLHASSSGSYNLNSGTTGSLSSCSIAVAASPLGLPAVALGAPSLSSISASSFPPASSSTFFTSGFMFPTISTATSAPSSLPYSFPSVSTTSIVSSFSQGIENASTTPVSSVTTPNVTSSSSDMAIVTVPLSGIDSKPAELGIATLSLPHFPIVTATTSTSIQACSLASSAVAASAATPAAIFGPSNTSTGTFNACTSIFSISSKAPSTSPTSQQMPTTSLPTLAMVSRRERLQKMNEELASLTNDTLEHRGHRAMAEAVLVTSEIIRRKDEQVRELQKALAIEQGKRNKMVKDMGALKDAHAAEIAYKNECHVRALDAAIDAYKESSEFEAERKAYIKAHLNEIGEEWLATPLGEEKVTQESLIAYQAGLYDMQQKIYPKLRDKFDDFDVNGWGLPKEMIDPEALVAKQQNSVAILGSLSSDADITEPPAVAEGGALELQMVEDNHQPLSAQTDSDRAVESAVDGRSVGQNISEADV